MKLPVLLATVGSRGNSFIWPTFKVDSVCSKHHDGYGLQHIKVSGNVHVGFFCTTCVNITATKTDENSLFSHIGSKRFVPTEPKYHHYIGSAFIWILGETCSKNLAWWNSNISLKMTKNVQTTYQPYYLNGLSRHQIQIRIVGVQTYVTFDSCNIFRSGFFLHKAKF